MKTFLINLDRSRERLARMQRRFDDIGVTFERIAAVDGLSMDQAMIDSFLRKRRQRRWNYGEIGCFLSHIKAWQVLVGSGHEYGAVFEDDAFMSTELAKLLADSGWIPADADIVRLETTFWRTEISRQITKISERFALHHLLSNHHGAGAYVISRKAAAFLLDNQHLLRTTLDSALFDSRELSCKALTIYQLNPAPVLQETIYRKLVSSDFEAASEITSTPPVPTPEWPLRLRKIWREIKRPAPKLIAGLKQHRRVNRNQSLVMRVAFWGHVHDEAERLYLPRH